LHTRYVDIPLDPSVLQFRTVTTQNDVATVTPRFLVGKYNDPKLGNMDVRAYGNYSPPVFTQNPTFGATADSLVLQVVFDFYRYGSPSIGAQHLQVFEVLDTLKSDYQYLEGLDTVRSTANYYNSSSVAISSTPIGDATFVVDPDVFDTNYPLMLDADTTNNSFYRLRIKITSPTLATELMNEMIKGSANGGNDPSSLINNFSQFSGKYKGLAFVMQSGDQIVGINPAYNLPTPTSKNMKLILYYTDGGVQTQADFLFTPVTNYNSGQQFPVTSFTSINSDYSATSLSGIQPNVDKVPFDNFYVQSGSALVTKFNLSKFYNYMDTIQNAIFSSAEIVLNNTSTSPPQQIQLRVLDQYNHFRSPYYDSLVNGIVAPVADPYFVKLQSVLTFGTVTSPTTDINTDAGVVLPVFHDTFQVSPIFITNFCQGAYRYQRDPRRINYFCLMVQPTEFQKTTNSLIFDKGVTLRLYYSVPIVKIQ